MYRTCSETTSPKMLLTFAGARQLRCAPIMTIVWVLVLICCGVVFEPYIVSAEMYEGDSCSTPKSGSGICTTLKKCKAMNNAISRGELTSNEVVTCGLAVYEELICCPKDNRMDTLATSTVPTSTVRDFWLDLLTTSTRSPGAIITTTTVKPDFWLHLLNTTASIDKTVSTTTTTSAPLVIGSKELKADSKFFDFSKLLANSNEQKNEQSGTMAGNPTQILPQRPIGVNHPNQVNNIQPTLNQIGLRPNQPNPVNQPKLQFDRPDHIMQPIQRNHPTHRNQPITSVLANGATQRENDFEQNQSSWGPQAPSPHRGPLQILSHGLNEHINNFKHQRNSRTGVLADLGRVMWPQESHNPIKQFPIGNSGRLLKWVPNYDQSETQAHSTNIFEKQTDDQNLQRNLQIFYTGNDQNTWNDQQNNRVHLRPNGNNLFQGQVSHSLHQNPTPSGAIGQPHPHSFNSKRDPIEVVNENLINAGVDVVKANLDNVETVAQQKPFTFPGPPQRESTTESSSRAVSLPDPFAPFQFRPQPDNYPNNMNNIAYGHFSSALNTSNETPTSTPIITRLPRPAVLACSAIDAELGAALSPHIIGGTVADVGEFPHMAAIGYTSISEGPGQYEFRCGGTLIEKRFVLTAAHCVNSRQSQPAIVRLGAVNFEDPAEMRNVVELKIKEIYIHPNYTNRQLYNDVAVLELERDAMYTNTVYPTCLYSDVNDPPSNSLLYVSGWGTISTKTGMKSNLLLKAQLNIVPLSSCNDSYVKYGLTRQIDQAILQTQLCAHDANHTKDACQGDSGGPLTLVVDESTKKYRVIGIISAGFSCASSTPGLYARVASYLDFIESIVWPTPNR